MEKKKRIVFLTGAGISEESGISTFRDAGGLWEEYDPMTVCSIKGWHSNPKLVQQFYNRRRVQLGEVEPNEAHRICKSLESQFDVKIITSNVDDLHERAGSDNVLHLHGELRKVCDLTKTHVEDIGYNLLSEIQFDKRPFIVFFGEDVPLMKSAEDLVNTADILVVIGTSLSVYPATSLLEKINEDTQLVYIDPNAEENLDNFFSTGMASLDQLESLYNITIIPEKAIQGMKLWLASIAS